MIRGEIKLRSKEPEQNEKWCPVALFMPVNGNEVENKGNGMEKVMLAKSSCIFMVKSIFRLELSHIFHNFILCFVGGNM